MEQLRALVADPTSLATTEAQRRELLQLTHQASRALETPFETFQRLAYAVRIGTEGCQSSPAASRRTDDD